MLEDALEDQRLDIIVFAGDILNSEEREKEWLNVCAAGKLPRKKNDDDDDDGVIDEMAYREFFINLTGFGVPVIFVPGHLDSPTSRLQKALSDFPNVINIQDAPYQIGGYTFTGWGGAIGPVDADGKFYCTKERNFKKKFSSGFDSDPEKTIFLVHTPPVSRVDIDSVIGEHVGSKVINEILEKHKPTFCFCGHAHGTPGQDLLASTTVVNPGPMFKGRYAIVDTEQHKVIFPTPLRV